MIADSSRSRSALPPDEAETSDDANETLLEYGVPAEWLDDNPLTETELREEINLWRGSGRSLDVRMTGAQENDVALLSTA